MTLTRRPIFRSEALRRYGQGRDRPVLLRVLSPPTFLCLWLLLGLLVAAGCVAWFAKAPVYASGSAAVVEWKGDAQGIREGVVLVAFLPPQDLAHLQVGQALLVTFDPTAGAVNRALIAVEPRVIAPAAAQQQFGLSAHAAQVVSQPAAVAIARFEPAPSGLPVSTYVGSVYQVRIQVGVQSVFSLLPFFGQSLGDNS
jgi:hypothetical protein